jgi:hypothetical protein
VRPSLLFCGLTGPGLEVAQDQFPDGLKAVPSRIVSTLMRGRRRVPAGENGDGVVVEVLVSAGLDPGVGERVAPILVRSGLLAWSRTWLTMDWPSWSNAAVATSSSLKCRYLKWGREHRA